MERIDEIDVQILKLLQANGRMKRNKIADEVGLSLPSVSDRMRKLEERDVITGYHAVVNPKRLHVDITAFIRVTVDGADNYEEFIRRATGLDSVLEVHLVTGEGSHILKVKTKDTTSLQKLLIQIQSWPGVHGTSTSIVLSSYKETLTVAVTPSEIAQYDEEYHP